MSSRARNFRRRADEEEEEAEVKDQSASNASKIVSKSAAATAKHKKVEQKVPKLLSFVEDEDAEDDGPFSRPSSKKTVSSATRTAKPSQVSPASSSGHKITSSKDRVRVLSSSLPSNVQPQAGTYTIEALRELQKNTKTLAGSSRPAAPAVEAKSEPVLVLKGLVKPSVADTLKEVDELENGDDRERDGVRGRLDSMRIGKGNEAAAASGSAIPDQATIEKIRAKRERLRQSRAAAPDYIALDGGSNHGEAEGLSDEEPEFQGRIKMLGEKSDIKGIFEEIKERSISPNYGNDDVGNDDDEEDDEERLWEEEQVRKGLGKRMDDGPSKLATSSVQLISNTPRQMFAYPNAARYSSVSNISIAPSIGRAVAPSRTREVQSIPQQADNARNALQDYASRLKDSFGRTVNSLAKTEENLSASISNVTNFEKSLSAAGEKFIFMQKTRDFVSVICDFLQHKAPFIEELEEEMQKLHEERASAALERRNADNNDEMIEVEAAVNAATSVFKRGGNSASIVATATEAAAAAAAAVRQQGSLPAKLDEFGRDENQQKHMDSLRRAEARARRKACADSKRMSAMEGNGPHLTLEGESSTDESDSETAAYESNNDQLLQTAEQIFSDASEEFSQLSVVKETYEKWKKLYSTSYRDAYMALSVPAIFSPYVRLELLKWDPLHKNIDFDNMKWHSLLFDYGLTNEEFSADDADANLVPHLVEKVALPILHHQVANCWDVLSTAETKNAVSATSLIATYDLASSEPFGELLVVVRKRLADAVADLVVPTWNPFVLAAVSNASRVAAYRFGVSVRLMRNICLWKDVLSVKVIEKLALDELFGGKVLPHLRAIKSNIHDAIIRTERTIASLSGVCTGATASVLHSEKLKPLVDYVLLLGKMLEKRASGASESETNGLARRVRTMLVELNEYDEARAIARTFHLKEAL